MTLGDTFVWSPEGGREHLYIAVTDPRQNEGKFAAFNLTHSVHGAMSFTLKKGDHPYIIKDSDINFGDALIVSAKKLEAEIQWNGVGQSLMRPWT